MTTTPKALNKNTPMMIVSFGRGNVIVCPKMALPKDDEWLKVYSGSAVIRQWGTQHGLAEIAVKGPTTSTTLDAIPVLIEIPGTAIHFVYECTPAASASFVEKMAIAETKLLAGKA